MGAFPKRRSSKGIIDPLPLDSDEVGGGGMRRGSTTPDEDEEVSMGKKKQDEDPVIIDVDAAL